MKQILNMLFNEINYENKNALFLLNKQNKPFDQTYNKNISK